MTNGSAMAGSAIRKAHPIWLAGRPLDVGEVVVAVAPPDHDAEHDREHQGRQQAAGEQRGDRDAGHRADGDQHEARRNGFGLRAGCGQQRHQIAGLGAALDHFGKQHRRNRGHVGGLRAGNAGDQIHRRDQHILQAATDVTEQAGEEADHGARHAGHLDQQAEEDEQRHRQQDEMAHAFVHSADHDSRRRRRRQRDVGEGRQAERKCDRHCREHHHRHQSDEEDQKVDVAERDQNRAQQHKGRAPAAATSAMAPPVSFQSPTDTSRNTANSGHQTESDRQGGRPPHIRNVERGSRDERFRRTRTRRPGGAPGPERRGVRQSPARRRNARALGLSIPMIAVILMCSAR